MPKRCTQNRCARLCAFLCLHGTCSECGVPSQYRIGKRSGSGMLDSAHEWQVAIRWENGTEFGVEGDVTATYIMHLPKEADRG